MEPRSYQLKALDEGTWLPAAQSIRAIADHEGKLNLGKTKLDLSQCADTEIHLRTLEVLVDLRAFLKQVTFCVAQYQVS